MCPVLQAEEVIQLASPRAAQAEISQGADQRGSALSSGFFPPATSMKVTTSSQDRQRQSQIALSDDDDDVGEGDESPPPALKRRAFILDSEEQDEPAVAPKLLASEHLSAMGVICALSWM